MDCPVGQTTYPFANAPILPGPTISELLGPLHSPDSHPVHPWEEEVNMGSPDLIRIESVEDFGAIPEAGSADPSPTAAPSEHRPENQLASSEQDDERNSDAIPAPSPTNAETTRRQLPTRSTRGVPPARYAQAAPSHKAFFTRVVQYDEFVETPRGHQAIREELEKMQKAKVWDWEDVVGKAEAARTDADALFVSGKLIFGIKNFELGVAHHKHKCRLVAQGCFITDAMGNPTKDEDYPFDTPASLLGVRLALWVASLEGNDAIMADIESAYLTAPLKGKKVYISLPAAIRPPSWASIRDPVVPLRKALYGLPRSGSDFMAAIRAKLMDLGWTESKVDKNVYVMHGMILVIYVDDLLLAGPKAVIHSAFVAISRCYTMNNREELSRTTQEHPARYLGMNIYMTQDHIIMDGLDYCRHVVDSYARLAEEELPRVKTPADGRVSNDDLGVRGQFADHCQRFIGMLLWLARTTRPDVAQAVGVVCRLPHRWTRYADCLLRRIMRYIKHQHKVIAMPRRATSNAPVRLLCYADADHAGCIETARSTSGWVTCVESGPVITTLDWGSKAQSIAAASTAVAELNAIHKGYTKSFAIADVLLTEFLQQGVRVVYRNDNMAAIQAIRNGYSSTMRSAIKTHNIDLSLLHDIMITPNGTNLLEYVKSADNLADLFTKPLSAEPFRSNCERLGIIILDMSVNVMGHGQIGGPHSDDDESGSDDDGSDPDVGGMQASATRIARRGGVRKKFKNASSQSGLAIEWHHVSSSEQTARSSHVRSS